VGRRDGDGVGATEDRNGHCDGAGGVDGAGEADGDAVGASDRAGVGDGDLSGRRDAATEGHGDGDEDEAGSQEWNKPDPKGTPSLELFEHLASRFLYPALGPGVCKACPVERGVDMCGERHCSCRPLLFSFGIKLRTVATRTSADGGKSLEWHSWIICACMIEAE